MESSQLYVAENKSPQDQNLGRLDTLIEALKAHESRYHQRFFHSVDEIDHYVDEILKLFDLILFLDQGFVNKACPSIYKSFLDTIQIKSAVHCSKSLRSLSQLRAEVAIRDLDRLRIPFNFDFPPKSTKTFRFGVFTNKLSADPETRALSGFLPGNQIKGLETYLFTLDESADPEVLSNINLSAVKLIKLSKSFFEIVTTLRNFKLDYLFFLNDTSVRYSTASKLVFFRVARKMGVNIATIMPVWKSCVDHVYAGDYYLRSADGREFESKVLGGAHPGYSFPSNWKSHDRLSPGRPKAPGGRTVFFSGASFLKINGDVVRIWGLILKRVPNSEIRLSVFPPHYSVKADYVSTEMLKIFSDLDIELSRIKFLKPARSYDEYSTQLSESDIYLDSFPFSSVTSIHDAVKFGVPPVVLQGAFLRNNHAPAILNTLGLTRLIAHSTEDYIKLAVELSSELASTTDLKSLLRERCRLLENTKGFFNNFLKKISDE